MLARLLQLLLAACVLHQCGVCLLGGVWAAGSAVDASAVDRGLVATDVKPLLLWQEGNNYHSDVAQKRFPGRLLGYVTPWNSHGYEVAVRWRGKFTHISPVWYQLKAAAAAEGQQGFRFELVGGHDVDQGWMAELRKPVTDAGCADSDAASQTCSADSATSRRPPLIVPRVIFELPPQALLQLLQQPSDALVLLVDEVKKQGFDGLVVETWLQWSAMQALSNEEFRKAAFAVLAWLADKLHAEDKVLVLAVPPVVPAQPARPAADVAHLQQLASRVDAWSVMTYDHSAAGGPGPNAPLPWQEQNVQQLVAPVAEGAAKGATAVPASKVLMGLNFYGYDFVRPDDDAGQSKKSKAKKKQAAAAAAQASPMMGDAFLAALRKYKPKLVWEEEHAEHRIRFKDTATGTRHTAYFPTPAALAARVQLAQRLGAGLSLWELGQGMDCFLDLL